MSTDRRHMDFYPTPQPLARAIVAVVADLWCEWTELSEDPALVIEPSAGEGAFVREMRARWPSSHIEAVDIRDTGAACVAAGANDFCRQDWPTHVKSRPAGKWWGICCGNLPFRMAIPHIEAALQTASNDAIVATILRLSFWETPARAELFRKYPLRAFAPIVQRPSFTGKGGDKTGVGLWIWQKGFQGRGEVLPPISWR